MPLETQSFSQKQRLAYIDFQLMFVGAVTRAQIADYFEKGLTSATKDINLYKALCPANMQYDSKEKQYFATEKFKPLFDYESGSTLTKLANQMSDGFDVTSNINFVVDIPNQLNLPDIFIVAKLVQAVLKHQPVVIEYVSQSCGVGCEIVPHAIVNNGQRWHVRAFDCGSERFKDFVLTRITSVTMLRKDILPHQDKLNDHQWMRMIPLQVVPHPYNVKYPDAIALDYGMKDGVLGLNVRAAMAGYLLRQWNVDCTADAELVGTQYQLWLKNRQTLFGAENLDIAPGYVPELAEL